MSLRQKLKDPLIEILKKEFEQKKRKNSAYSLRAFSNYLEMDPSNLSKIMNGQLAPREKLQRRLAKKLGLGEQEIRTMNDKNYFAFDMDVFHVVSDWYHFAILEIFKLQDVRHEVKWIAEKLDLPPKEVSAAIARLQKCGLLKYENGHYLNVVNASSSILHVPTSKAHRNQQKQILEKAITALEEVPVEERSQSSMVMAIDKARLDDAKELIKEFRRNLESFLTDSQNLNDVYQLSVSLYPLTNSHKGEKP